MGPFIDGLDEPKVRRAGSCFRQRRRTRRFHNHLRYPVWPSPERLALMKAEQVMRDLLSSTYFFGARSEYLQKVSGRLYDYLHGKRESWASVGQEIMLDFKQGAFAGWPEEARMALAKADGKTLPGRKVWQLVKVMIATRILEADNDKARAQAA